MIDKLIYLFLIGILIYIYFILEEELRKEYYKKDFSGNSLGTGKFFFIALIFPRAYFRKDKLLEGWIIYFVNILIVFSTVYLLIKLFNPL